MMIMLELNTLSSTKLQIETPKRYNDHHLPPEMHIHFSIC